MPEIVTDTIIEASAERVWQELTDVAAYPGWNPVLRRVQGHLAVEQTLTVVRIGADGGEVVERPTVIHFRPVREIRWRTRLGLPWLLDTERGFKIERLGPEQVRFVHWQSRSGLLAYLVLGASEAAARDQLDVMNLALKAQVEHGAAPHAAAHADSDDGEVMVSEAHAEEAQHAAPSPI
jgi:hypothetical protein